MEREKLVDAVRTHRPKHFLGNADKADFGQGGTLRLACKGVVGRSGTLPNQSRWNHPGGSRGDQALRGQAPSCDCPGALFS